MKMTIKNADESLLDDIERLEIECFSLPWTREQLFNEMTGEDRIFLAAVEESGELIGYAGAMTVIDEGYISNVAVSPKFRRRGAGDALVCALEKAAREKGLAFLTLEVRAGNAAATALYEKHGYEPVGRRKNYYEKPREDAILMTLFLK